MEIFNENLPNVDKKDVEIYILGDFNINLRQNGHYVFQNHYLLLCQSVSDEFNNYFAFCKIFGLKQLLEIPTRITCSSSSIIGHILASFSDRVTQRGILNVRLSDHQLIYFTRKITRTKRGDTNRYTIKFVYDYYKNFSLSENFKLDSTTEDCLIMLLKNAEVKKAAGID